MTRRTKRSKRIEITFLFSATVNSKYSFIEKIPESLSRQMKMCVKRANVRELPNRFVNQKLHQNDCFKWSDSTTNKKRRSHGSAEAFKENTSWFDILQIKKFFKRDQNRVRGAGGRNQLRERCLSLRHDIDNIIISFMVDFFNSFFLVLVAVCASIKSLSVVLRLISRPVLETPLFVCRYLRDNLPFKDVNSDFLIDFLACKLHNYKFSRNNYGCEWMAERETNTPEKIN